MATRVAFIRTKRGRSTSSGDSESAATPHNPTARWSGEAIAIASAVFFAVGHAVRSAQPSTTRW